MASEMTSYIRVQTTYYKHVYFPTISGQTNKSIVPWNKETIREDHPEDKGLLTKIPKYDGFTCIPSHTEFKQEINGFYNTYYPLSNQPIKGELQTTMKFINHIFGNQMQLGIDYLQILYTKPTQILPILCLVSKKRSTGKSTFLKWLKAIFEYNLTYLTNDSFGSQFNADWANKLLICIDEVLFNKEELTERIKFLSTTNVNKLEAKGKDKREVEFFGKFILCSNNESTFIKIDGDETRFWVLKIPSIKDEHTDMLSSLKNEIPAFLHLISNRKLTSENKTRMWFTPSQIKTKALLKLVNNNRSRAENELANILISIMEKDELTEVNLCPMDAVNILSRSRIRCDLTQMKRLLKIDWGLTNQRNSNSYDKYTIWSDGDIVSKSSKGRYYTVSKEFLCQKFDDLMTD